MSAPDPRPAPNEPDAGPSAPDPAPSSVAPVPIESTTPPDGPNPKASAAAAEAADKKRSAFDLLTLYNDNYFVTGFTKKHQAKFQFSVKFDLWPNEGHHAVHFAYSQVARWNVYERSAPFAENNYSPELFYTFYHSLPRFEPEPGCGFARERLGAQHESNGESGNTSRGWNRIYASTRFACYQQDRRHYALADLKVWAPPFATDGNSDITKYYGYGELSLSAGRDGASGWINDFDFTVRMRKGTRDWGTGSVELDLHWTPPYPDAWRFTPRLVAQLFQGQGETLALYNEVVTAFRIGIGFADRSSRAR